MVGTLRSWCRVSHIVGAGLVCLAAASLVAAAPARVLGKDRVARGHKQVSGETLVGGITNEEYAAQQADLHAWLMQEMPAGLLQSKKIVVNITDAERADLESRQDSAGAPTVVGRTKPIGEQVRFQAAGPEAAGKPRVLGNGLLATTPDGGFVWATTIRSDGAGAIRVHFTGVDLPADADLFLFTLDGQAFGPYSARGPNGDGDFWSDTVFGSEGIVLLRHYGPEGAADLPRISFVLADVGHIGPKFVGDLTAAAESFCSFNGPCIQNASCNNGTPADPAKSAVALMQWISGQFINTCTGGLLNDTVSTSQIPYFLTANHCLSTSTPASNMQFYFQFSIACGSTSCPAQTHPGGQQRLGSTVKATGTAGDFTLLQMNQTPPAGSVFLGWNSTPVANTNNAPLYRISHPAWAPQAYSSQHVDTSAPTCQGWPRGQRIYSRGDIGGTEGGSSGSPILNASSQVVGQLSGACGTNTGNACDNVNNATVDGAFAYYWPSVQPFLSPGGGCVPVAEVCNDGVDNDCDTLVDCADSSCAGSPSCPSCSPSGASCTANSQCCSHRCSGPGGRKTCR